MQMQNFTLCSKLSFAFLLTFILSFNAIAQQKTVASDDIVSKLNLNREKNESPVLFIHFDKNIYVPNEKVWFTGYLFKSFNFDIYKALSIALVKNDDRQVVLDDKFVLSNGVVLGSTTIPDSVAAGDYSFIAYTNLLLNGKPNVLFTQRVTIKSADNPSYTASLNVLDTSINASKQKVMLLVNFLGNDKHPETLPVSYYVGKGTKPVLKGNVKTEIGKYIFEVPSSLLSPGNNKLHVIVKHGKEIKELTMDLPVNKKPAIVKFFPEGGTMVNNIAGYVGWEVTDFAGNPVKANAILFRDKKPFANIASNSYGINRFVLRPTQGHKYYLKLVGVNRKDTLYELPPAINTGPVLTIGSAVVNDTLIARLRCNTPEKFYIVGHDYKEIYFSSPVTADTIGRRIKILLNDVPKGLLQLTVIDSLGRPFANRLIFAHFNRKNKLDIKTDSAVYSPRQKVTLKVKLDDPKMLDSGLVSVAVVQDNRFDIKNKRDIESYFYLQANLENLPLKENYLGTQSFDKQFLEDILLIKGWSKYTWLDMLTPQAADTAKFEYVSFKGNVTRKKKALSKSVPLMSFGNVTRVLETDEKGDFELIYDDLVTIPDNMVNYVVKGAPEMEYEVNLADPFIALNKKVAADVDISNNNFVEQPTSQPLHIPGLERSIKIKEVKIKAKAPRKIFANACGDYICRFNIFNCPNHPYESDNTLPVVGRRYMRYGVSTVYLGCGATDNKLSLKGIYLPRKFYVENVPEWRPDEPIYISTLYWKHLMRIRSTEYAELSFYTGDITGKFRVVVQGIGGNDVAYGEKTFTVFKPQVQ